MRLWRALARAMGARPQPVEDVEGEFYVTNGQVLGWCWNRAAKPETVCVTVFIDGIEVAEVKADRDPDDWSREGCWFRVPIPESMFDSRPHEFQMRAGDRGTSLPKEPPGPECLGPEDAVRGRTWYLMRHVRAERNRMRAETKRLIKSFGSSGLPRPVEEDLARPGAISSLAELHEDRITRGLIPNRQTPPDVTGSWG